MSGPQGNINQLDKLPPELIKIIEIAISSHPKLRKVTARISMTEFWEDNERGNLLEILSFFSQRHSEYGLGDPEKETVDRYLNGIPPKLRDWDLIRNESSDARRKLEAELMTQFDQAMVCILRIYNKYPHEDRTKLPPSERPSSKEANQKGVIRDLVDIFESVLTLRNAANESFLKASDQNILMAIASSNIIPSEKFRDDYERLRTDLQSDLPTIWNNIRSIDERLYPKVKELPDCFNDITNRLGDIRVVMSEVRKGFRELSIHAITTMLTNQAESSTVIDVTQAESSTVIDVTQGGHVPS